MKTKNKIVEAAIALFNEHGVNNVSIRDIGGVLGISSGNFAYHFKNKEALIEYFYQHMYEGIEVPTDFGRDPGLRQFDDLLDRITEFMERYRFFYSDIVDIFRMCPGVREDLAANYQGRKDIYKGFIQELEDNNHLQGLDDPKLLNEITHTIWFTMTFWQSQKKVLPPNQLEVSRNFIKKQVWMTLMPYMTDVGRVQFEKMNF